ncbi:autotransporter domain-containing protein [Bradyrhizobium sp.]|uniref:autotransporter domain-containing protein n=1 Tax=Bradyrhizobium sp. TaxID=376 RepID=UPI0039E57698
MHTGGMGDGRARQSLGGALRWFFGALAILATLTVLDTRDAHAQCATTGTDPVTLTCAVSTATTSTTNTTSPNGATSDRTQQFNANLIGQINSGVTIGGEGLDIVTTKPGGGITFINNGTVNVFSGSSALQLDGAGGAVSYTGSGSIQSAASSALTVNNSSSTGGNITVDSSGNITAGAFSPAVVTAITNAANSANTEVTLSGTITGGSGVSATTLGTGNVTVTTSGDFVTGGSASGIVTATTSGTNTVNINGGVHQTSGPANVSATATTGNVFINMTAGTLQSGLGTGGDVQATTTSGNITVNASGGTIGTSAVRVSSGVVATTASGAINVTTTTIFANDIGINAQVTSGGSGGITIVANGNISAANNVAILSSITGGSGNTSITYNGVLNADGGAISATSSSTGSMTVGGSGSINAQLSGSALVVTNNATSTSGNITINPTGNIVGSASSAAIVAQITNAANNANIVVTQVGTISGGAAIAASTVGGGNVTVTSSNDTMTTLGAAALAAASTSGTSTVNVTGGLHQAEAGANVSVTATTGDAVFNMSGGTLQSALGNGGGVEATTTSGNILVNASGGTIGTSSVRVENGLAATTASGAININATTIFAANTGISAQVTSGGSGGITIVANGAISATNDVDILTSIVGGTGNTSITYNAALNANSGGISATSSSTGSMSVGGSGSLTVVLGTGITVSNTASSTSGDITINPTGGISASTAIRAEITDAANGANIVVAPTGSISGSTGIIATTAGSGNVTVTTSNDVTASGTAISATATSGISTVNIKGGTVESLGGGAHAVDVTATTGRIVVNNAGTVVGSDVGLNLTGGTGNAISNTGSISAATGIVTSAGATSVFNAGSITGTGGTAIRFAGAGNTLTIAPTSVITGNAVGVGTDTFQLGGASGNGSFDAALIGAAAQYQGFASFNKVDNATWTLTGTNAAVLPWTVLQGTLNVTGTLANSPFTVQGGVLSVDGTVGATTVNGGILSGTGTLGSLTVNGGTVAPGHSIGTLNVAGPVSFTGGIYQVETNLAGQSDKIAATGAATLSGGTVQVIAQSGAYSSAITYTILTADDGRTGTFSGVTTNIPYLRATLVYDANDVFLNLVRNQTFFQDAGLTPNQRAVGVALDRFPVGNPLFAAAANVGAAAIPATLDSLSGEIHASVQSVLIDDSLFVRDAVQSRLRQATYAGGSGAMAALGLGGPIAYAGPANAYASAGRPAFPVKAVPAQPAADLTWWTQGIGAWGSFDGDGNAAGVTRSLGGVFTGLDRRFGDDWRAGIAAGYSNSSVGLSARASSANIDTAHVAAYAGTSRGPLNFRAGTAFAWSEVGTSRSVLFPGFFDSVTAHYHASTSQVFGEVGYGFAVGKLAIEPFAGLAYVHLDTGSFSETGGAAALAVARSTEDVGYSSLGVRLAQSFALFNGTAFVPRLSAYWQHAYGNTIPTASLSFLSTGSAFSVAGVPLGQDAAVVEAGFDWQLKPNARIGVSYFGELAGHATDHAIKGRFSLNF